MLDSISDAMPIDLRQRTRRPVTASVLRGDRVLPLALPRVRDSRAATGLTISQQRRFEGSRPTRVLAALAVSPLAVAAVEGHPSRAAMLEAIAELATLGALGKRLATVTTVYELHGLFRRSVAREPFDSLIRDDGRVIRAAALLLLHRFRFSWEKTVAILSRWDTTSPDVKPPKRG
jgi:hypothetical protein